ncbi:MAG: 3-deoxy-manno-octulosonate cytidylyltransferase [Epsilonproteobacteria bacterium]|nr:3-deoxy-manno-octulosonate cytidylyltransferase [Campylobacterota bacterium]
MFIIPARLESTRFPKKVLEPINNIPMVILTAQKAKKIANTIIATDSIEVIDVAKEYGFEAILTSKEHNSGTDRVFEAVKKLNLNDNEIVVNLQADEPFIEEEVLKEIHQLTKECNNNIIGATLYKKISQEEAKDPNIVKVVTDENSLSLYFSRSIIPFNREKKEISYKAHIGIYGYKVENLKKFCSLKHSFLEEIEKLEQLRALEAGYKYILKEVNSKSIGIDTKEDLQKALKLFGKGS